jgi:hypothetical protein
MEGLSLTMEHLSRNSSVSGPGFEYETFRNRGANKFGSDSA